MRLLILIGTLSLPALLSAQQITAAGQPASVDIRAAGPSSIRITLRPLSFRSDFPGNPAVAERSYPRPVLSLHEITQPVSKKVRALNVEVRPNPLAVVVAGRGRPAARAGITVASAVRAIRPPRQARLSCTTWATCRPNRTNGRGV